MDNHIVPSYSGVTINISNPTVNAGNPYMSVPKIKVTGENRSELVQNQQNYTSTLSQNSICDSSTQSCSYSPSTIPVSQIYDYQQSGNNYGINENLPQDSAINNNNQTANANQQTADSQNNTNSSNSAKSDNNGYSSYPPQYYMNNYNNPQYNTYTTPNDSINNHNQPIPTSYNGQNLNQEEDLSASKEIINDLNLRQAEQNEMEKNAKKTRVIALTNEYIMSLENYLNNQNTEIRLMAAKEILTRLDEDKDRYNDAALNALLNKMLQDPEKLVRIAAMSAFSSQLASGNDYTVQLLTQIQQNPNSDKEDVVEAADILLKMSANTEVKYTPVQKESQEQ